jgi:hypothetical protein
MLYKSIVLELLREQTALCEQLTARRQLLSALHHYSSQLKAAHQRWTGILTQTCPGSPKEQIDSAAMEVAIEELRAHLPKSLPEDEAFLPGEATDSSNMPSA